MVRRLKKAATLRGLRGAAREVNKHQVNSAVTVSSANESPQTVTQERALYRSQGTAFSSLQSISWLWDALSIYGWVSPCGWSILSMTQKKERWRLNECPGERMILLGTGNSGEHAVSFGRASGAEDTSFPGQGDQQQGLSATGLGPGRLCGTQVRWEAVASLSGSNSLSLLMTDNFTYVLKIALYERFYINFALFLKEKKYNSWWKSHCMILKLFL